MLWRNCCFVIRKVLKSRFFLSFVYFKEVVVFSTHVNKDRHFTSFHGCPNSSTHFRLPAHIKSCMAVLLHHITLLKPMSVPHDGSLALQYSPTYFSIMHWSHSWRASPLRSNKSSQSCAKITRPPKKVKSCAAQDCSFLVGLVNIIGYQKKGGSIVSTQLMIFVAVICELYVYHSGTQCT